MKQTDKRKDRIPKHTKEIVTVDSILTFDNVKDLIQRLIKDQAEITDMICIYHDQEGNVNQKCTSHMPIERIVTMLEQVKISFLFQDDGEEE